MASKPLTHKDALQQHAAALQKNTSELKKHSAALTQHTAVLKAVNARQIVYGILGSQFPDAKLTDATNLADLGFDPAALAGLAAQIREQVPNVQTGAIQACQTIGDVIKVVAAA